jgi:hypothetical protein
VPLDDAFTEDCPYGPGGTLLEEIVEVDVPQSRVVARMVSGDDLPLTREQRAHPVRHPRHVSGGLMVHMTGIMGFVHAYYVLGLRHGHGWIGYGARIHKARFAALAEPTMGMLLSCTATQLRRGDQRVLARYDFRFTQRRGGEDVLVYEGDQTAFWMRADATAAQ